MLGVMRKRLIDQATVRELLDYCPERGKFFFEYRQRCWFRSDRSFHVFNSRFPGIEALACTDTHGYLYGKLLNRPLLAHRAAWLFVHGTSPKIIDHLSHDRRDNRICNLQGGSVLSNNRNKSLSESSSTGHVGIYENEFSFVVMIQGRYLGSYDSFDEAAAVRQAAQIERRFAPGHGAAPRGGAHA
jgi:HNH endonuclease